MSNQSISRLRRRRLSYLIAALAGASTIPFASAQPGSEPSMEEVVVTGSRMQRADNATSPQPISVIGAEELSNTPNIDISEILNENPALLASETSANTGSTSNVGRASNVGGSALNLRGLGTQRTLTLVNGRRHVSGIEGTSSVDVSTIPSALVERVEVLTGGASAVYGADAVTGVVNFVLKDDFEGVEFDVRPGVSARGDAETLSLRGSFGRNFQEGRGNVVVGVQHDRSEGLKRRDRGFMAGGSWGNDVNPALRFQSGDIDAATMPNFSQFYNFENTGQFQYGLRIPTADSFSSIFQSQFGDSPDLTPEELALIERAANATPRAILPERVFNITSPFGVVAIGDFGSGNTPLGSEPDLDGDGVPDCLQSFTGYNSSLGGASSFGAAGGCWYIDEDGQLNSYEDGLVAGNFNQFGATQSIRAPGRTYIIPQDQKFAINLNGRYDITNSTEVFVESKYVYHEIEFGGGPHHATDLLYGAPDNPFLPESLRPFAQNDGVSWLGPGGLYISRDSTDWGNNFAKNERHTYRFVAGFQGALDQLGMDYEVSANYGRFDRTMTSPETVVTDRFFAAIDAVADPTTGQAVCRSDLDPTAYPQSTPFNFPSYVGGGVQSSFFTFQPGDGQCKPANIWAGQGGISQESIDFFTYDRQVEETIEQAVLTGFVTGDSSMFFNLPAGPVAFAAGTEWREEKSSQSFDSYDQGILPVSGVTSEGLAFQAGDLVGDVSNAASLGGSPGNRLLNTSAKYDVWDVFAEVSVPILSGQFMAEEVTLDAAMRRADYSTFGSSTTFGLGAVWMPVYDLRFRANYSEAVRVPNLFELYSPEQGQGFRPNDPCDASQISSGANPELRQQNCVEYLTSKNVEQSNIFDSQGNYIFADPLSAGFPGVTGGNPELQPEEATTITFGVVMQPRWVDNLTFSVDYWDIEIDQAISEISAQNIVDSCYDSPSINNPFCDLIDRNQSPTSAQSGGFTFLRQTQLNFGAAEARGVDVNVAYNFGIGAFNFGLTGSVTKTLQLDFIEPTNPGEPAFVNTAIMEMRRPEWAGQTALNVERGPFSVALRSQYLSKQALTGQIQTLEQNYGPAGFSDVFTSHNLSGAWRYSDELRFYGGVGNLTNEKPFVTSTNYPISAVGRNYYLGATMRF